MLIAARPFQPGERRCGRDQLVGLGIAFLTGGKHQIKHVVSIGVEQGHEIKRLSRHIGVVLGK
ncbi:hypothetical protein D3C76_1839060 [compost metagenome]